MKYVLSLDVALCNTGYTLFYYAGKEWRIKTHGVIQTKTEHKKRGIYKSDDQVRRIKEMMTFLMEMEEKYEYIDCIVAELPTGGAQNANAAESMSIAKTVVAALSVFWDIPLLSVTPSDVKVAATGKKNASKNDMCDAAKKFFPEVAEDYVSKRAKSGWVTEFEHVADSIGAFLAVKDHNIIKVMR